MNRVFLLILMVLQLFGCIASFCQSADKIFQASVDSINKRDIFCYESAMQEFGSTNNSPVQRSNVILQKSSTAPLKISYLISVDFLVIAYDGEKEYIISTESKSVTIDSPHGFREHHYYDCIIPVVLYLQPEIKSYLNPGYLSQDGLYWILSLKLSEDNRIETIWINKATMLPEIFLINNNNNPTFLKIKYQSRQSCHLPDVKGELNKYNYASLSISK